MYRAIIRVDKWEWLSISTLCMPIMSIMHNINGQNAIIDVVISTSLVSIVTLTLSLTSHNICITGNILFKRS